MRARRPAVLRFVPLVLALLASLSLAPAAAAHGHLEVGEYGLTIGWVNEPTFVGQPNGIEVFIEHHDTEAPVTDLTGEDLTVTVSTAGQDSEAIPLQPGFSLEGGFGTPGSYEAELTPTTPGEYTVHIVGTIHDTAVDVSMTSGEETFSSVRSSSEIEFPVKNPTMADVATRLDRLDGRIQELQATELRITTLETGISDARAAAERASTLGLLVGGAGLVAALVALYVGWRAGKRAGSA
jgi:hypothetical protein